MRSTSYPHLRPLLRNPPLHLHLGHTLRMLTTPLLSPHWQGAAARGLRRGGPVVVRPCITRRRRVAGHQIPHVTVESGQRGGAQVALKGLPQGEARELYVGVPDTLVRRGVLCAGSSKMERAVHLQRGEGPRQQCECDI